MQDLINIFKQNFKEEQLLFNEPMKKHTSFKIGGNADIIILPKTINEIKTIIKYCLDFNVNYYIVGNGTNLLVKDKGFRGVIIKLLNNFNNIEIINQNIIKASAGATLYKISKTALEHSLTGLEFAFGIPGTIGGGVCMNAGAYGGELKDIVKSVTVLNKDQIITLTNEECNFVYRNSRILQEKMVVLEVELVLSKGDKQKISERMEELIFLRNSKQPVDYPSAGSIFKRPVNNFAGKLIMEAGFKGKKCGGACVSEKHCGFIINYKDATCKDVETLIENITDEVYKQFNVRLEKEVRIIGEN